MLNVAIIGVGRVGGALALSLPSDRYRIAYLVDRTLVDITNIAAELSFAVVSSDAEVLALGSPDVVLITTQDTELKDAVHALVGKITRSTIFHTSGSTPSSILEPFKAGGNAIGSIHPLVSISSAELGPERFPGAFFCIEGDEKAVEIGKQIATDLGGRPFTIDTKFKTLYHASAVTACGHLVALFDAAVEMMTKCGLSVNEATEILLPLVTSTVRNLEHQSTAAALTGTFARADTETLTRHLTALNENVSDDLLEIYLLLGERSLELAARQGVSPERIDKMRSKVAVAKSKLKW
ncbi:MAG TPA: Rossmann-like and DUF2520 domain-containing protein [Pyrinomonadaceae bacterium]|jgi:predicted short-subunit dehydrogenase-like oxidoreductase (DUF2520 family)|nr:Rossmann-like and DUF2520 domain-containing protein [Pyrinomonadaceae bacterium]